MRVRSAISAMTVVALLPMATGCESRQTVHMENDPIAGETAARLREGKPVEISGYSTWSDGFEAWRGNVLSAPPDSLEFVRDSPSWAEGRGLDAPRFRLARRDVATLEVVRPDGTATVAVVAMVVATGAILLLVGMVRALNDPDNWGPGIGPR